MFARNIVDLDGLLNTLRRESRRASGLLAVELEQKPVGRSGKALDLL